VPDHAAQQAGGDIRYTVHPQLAIEIDIGVPRLLDAGLG
jgi:hypothetical protein